MKKVLAAAVCILLAACGGGSGNPSTPTTPTTPTPTPAANRAPVISSMSVSPNFGIANISSFIYAASASDPDNDPITYSWNLAGNAASGSSGQVVFTNGFDGTATVTVSDGKGGSATDSRPFTVGSMTGNWSGTNASLGVFTMSLTQTGTLISGTYADTSRFGPGRTDPAQPGIIRPDASFEVRIKQGGFTDFTFRGTMDNTGRRLTGGIFGSGFSGQPFVMTK